MEEVGKKKMRQYKYKKFVKSQLKRVETFEGESIEEKVERVTLNNEPISDGAPLIYKGRKEGISAGANIKTDRFEIAIDAMDKVSKSKVAKRESFEIEKSSKDEPIQATE